MRDNNDKNIFHRGAAFGFTAGITGGDIAGPLSISDNRVFIDTSGSGKFVSGSRRRGKYTACTSEKGLTAAALVCKLRPLAAAEAAAKEPRVPE